MERSERIRKNKRESGRIRKNQKESERIEGTTGVVEKRTKVGRMGEGREGIIS